LSGGRPTDGIPSDGVSSNSQPLHDWYVLCEEKENHQQQAANYQPSRLPFHYRLHQFV
jgi:hypothetical protein